MRTAEVAFLALVAYVPFLVSSPGRVSADSKQALYVDPGQFLSRAVHLWDPSFGAGTVPHQHIGYLWPMGPWFWAFERLGVPDWVAQRLWWGTLVVAAALGTRWLLRSLGAAPLTATAVALVYALTPYQLAFTARASVLLLPWVGLPWLVELTRRAVHHGGWRHPALFGLVVATVAGVNATSLVLVGLGPVLVLVHAALAGRSAWRRALAAGWRLAAASTAVSAWWLAGLRVQGGYGLPVLQLTENLTDVARWSLPADVLRGLGNWFFAGRDRLGWSLDQAEAYLEDDLIVAATLVLPVAALAVAVWIPGRVRTFAVACTTVALVVGVGAWPAHRPSPFGRAFAWFVDETSAGLALRNSHRIVPLLVLGVALLLALGIEHLPRRRHRLLATAAVATVAVAAMAPVLAGGYLSRHLDRDEALPQEWLAAAEVLGSRGHDPVGNPFRVLEVPGTPFAAHRWGNTVEPVLPSLVDRPQVAREVLPYGSAATADLLDAFDRRLQEGIFEPQTTAAFARLLASSDVLVRSDLAFERFRTPEPSSLWRALTRPPIGLAAVEGFGDPVVNRGDPRLAPVDERGLHFESLVGTAEPAVGAAIPPVGVLAVEDPLPLLQAVRADAAVVLAGDGDGLVDAVAAGLVDGRVPVVYADSLDDDRLALAVESGAALVLTDSNRRRIQTWFYAIRDTRGPTERSGETLIEPSGYDRRIDPFGGLDDSSRSVVEHLGATVTATATGGAARPEDRAIAAVDGDRATSWRVGGADPRGHRLSLVLDHPVVLDRLTITQPLDGPRDRVLEQVRLHVDGAEPLDIELGPGSLTPQGQLVTFPARTVSRLEVELTRVSSPPFDPAVANAVGIAELVLGDLEVAETVVMPRSLLDRLGPSSASAGLDLVMTRLRYDPYDRGRTDVERRLDRTFDLPVARTFGLGGIARLNPSAPDAVLDQLLATDHGVAVEASSRLAGDLSARARSALDGRTDTAWTAAFGEQVGQWIEVRLDQPRPLGSVAVAVVVDELHSAPTRLRVEVDGSTIGLHQLSLPPAGAPGATHTEVIALPGAPVERIRLVVEEVDRRSAPPGEAAVMATLPVAVTEITLGGVANETPPAPAGLDTGCRDDLLQLDGRPLPIRIAGSPDAIRSGLPVELCDDAVELGAGRWRLESTPGHRSGIDLDRLVLSSAAGGAAAEVGVRGGADRTATRVVEVDAGPTRWSATLDSDGRPFWLVLAQSDNDGWQLAVDGATVGERTLVNGYANGWLVEPARAGLLAVDLEWTPQRLVWWALAVSVLAVALALGFVLGGRPAAVPPSLLGPRAVPPPAGAFPWATVAVSAVATGVVVAAVSRPWIGAVATIVVVGRAALPVSRHLWAAMVPVAIAAGAVLDRPTLTWLALAFVLASVVGDEAATRGSGLRADVSPTPPARR